MFQKYTDTSSSSDHCTLESQINYSRKESTEIIPISAPFTMNAAPFIDQTDPSSWVNIGSNPSGLPMYSQRPSYGAVPQTSDSSPSTFLSSVFGKMSTRQLMHILSAMLMISLCGLVVELESPGVLARASRKMQTYFASSRGNYKSDMASDALKIHVDSYYAPVPAPFLVPRVSRFVEVVPTSEPTIHRDSSDAFFSPTSEPTEYRDSSTIFSPTSEPTEYRDFTYGDYGVVTSSSAGAMSAGSTSKVPTSEPTNFAGDIPQVEKNLPTSEPTIFTGDIPEIQQGNIPTSEPTIFAGEIPEVKGNFPSSEPTIYVAEIPDVHIPTSEPTVFTGEIPDVPESTAIPTTTTTSTSSSTATGENSQNVPAGTSTPSDIIVEGPTSDPTQFPTPTPTEATFLGYIGESVGDMFESIF